MIICIISHLSVRKPCLNLVRSICTLDLMYDQYDDDGDDGGDDDVDNSFLSFIFLLYLSTINAMLNFKIFEQCVKSTSNP